MTAENKNDKSTANNKPKKRDEVVLFSDGKGGVKPLIIPGEDFPDPVDVSDYVDLLVQRTMDRLKGKPDDGKPLMVLAGELHDNPYHQIIKIMMIERLKEQGVSVSVGIELPHDHIYKGFAEEYEKKVQRTLAVPRAKALTRFNDDPDGKKSMTSIVGNLSFATSDQSSKTFMKFLMDNKISTQFNDAAKIDETVIISNGMQQMMQRESYLDKDDPVTDRVMGELGFLVRDGITPVSIKGMTARNGVMVKKIIEHADRTKPQVYIQSCGMTHVAGGPTPHGPHPFKDSLAGMLKDDGYDVLAMPLFSSNYDEDVLPKEVSVRLSAEEMVWDKAPAGDVSVVYPPGKARNIVFRAMERRILSDAFNAASQGKDRCIDEPYMSKCRKEYAELIKEMILGTKKEDSIPLMRKRGPFPF